MMMRKATYPNIQKTQVQHTMLKNCVLDLVSLLFEKDLCYVIQDLINVMDQNMQFSCLVCISGISMRQDVEEDGVHRLVVSASLGSGSSTYPKGWSLRLEIMTETA